MKGVLCYELFGGIALKIHTFSFSLYMNIILFVLIPSFTSLMYIYFNVPIVAAFVR